MQDAFEAPKTIRGYIDVYKESIRVYGWVWSALIADHTKKHAKQMMALMFCSYAVTLMLPFFVGWLVDNLIADNMDGILLALGGIAGVSVLGRTILHHKRMCLREIIIGDCIISLNERSNDMFFEKSLGQHLKENEELSSSNVEKGRASVLEIESMILFEGLDAFMSVTIPFVLLWFISWVAGLVMLGAVFIYMGWSFLLNVKVMQVCTPIDKDWRALNRHRTERWEQIERVKSCAKEKEEHAVMYKWIKSIIGDDREFWLWYIKQGTMRGFTHVCALIGVLAYGAWAVKANLLAVGMFIPLYSWTRMMTDNMWRVSHVEHRLNWNMPSVRSMMRALTMKTDVVEKQDASDVSDEPMAIQFNGVSFGYPPEEGKENKKALAVLKNVSFDIQPGEKVALLGRSGAGKTTIMRLLQRSMDPTQGGIWVNGVDLKDLRLASLLEKIGYIAQQPAVLSGTLRYNLLYGQTPEERAKISDEMLWELMRKLEVDFGDRLTEGLDTKVGKKGVKLSGGEAQRVMIAAAVLKNPHLMIIDEATSSLDSTTEKSVQKGLAEILEGDISALIIAHRLSTVEHVCDKFIVMRPLGELVNGDSQVEAVGSSFEELHKISPTFRQLATDQGIAIAQ